MTRIKADGFIHNIPFSQNLVNTETRQFKNFFGNSVVVDENGNPLIVYHQTDADFEYFDFAYEKAGRYDSVLPTGVFAKNVPYFLRLGGQTRENSKQIPVYMRIEKPLRFNNREEAETYWKNNVPGYKELSEGLKRAVQDYKDREEYIDRNYLYTQDENDDIWEKLTNDNLANLTKNENALRRRMKERINAYLAASEYDGIILEKDKGTGGTVKTYIALSPYQVKHATENVGLYDKTNKKIRYDLDINNEYADIHSEPDYYTYENLIKQPEIIVTDIPKLGTYNSGSELLNAAKKNLEEEADSFTGVKGKTKYYVYVSSIKRNVLITEDSLRHSIYTVGAEQSTLHVGKILKNAVIVNETNSSERNSNNYANYHLVAISNDGDSIIFTKFLCKRYKNSYEVESFDVLYSINDRIKENPARSKEFTNNIYSRILYRDGVPMLSIKDMLEFVKNDFDDILPKEVLSHWGIKRREMHYSPYLNFDLDISDNNESGLSEEERQRGREEGIRFYTEKERERAKAARDYEDSLRHLLNEVEGY